MRGKLNILFTIPNFITAGSGRAMLNIIERLDRARFAPAVCVSRKGGKLDQEVEKLGIPFIEAPFTVEAIPYHRLPLRAWRAARVFRPHGFDAWHSFHYGNDYTEAIIARLSGAKAWIFTKKNMNWHRRAWYVRSFLAKRIAVQNTDMMRDFYGGMAFRHKARLVPRGVVTQKFRPDTPPRLQTRRRLAIKEGEVLIGCVANLVIRKGHSTLIEAVARVTGVHLVTIGKPLEEDYVAGLRKLIGELRVADRVHLLDFVEDVPAFLAEVDVFVLPTWGKWGMEGCPVALLEAMSCGCACIATDIAGSHDLLEHNRSGLVVPPENVAALAAAIQQLAASPELRPQLGRAARQRVLDHFTIEKEVAAHEALYAEVLGLN
jgi:glycosyltransferase involved in cell wall biosynthesis